MHLLLSLGLFAVAVAMGAVDYRLYRVDREPGERYLHRHGSWLHLGAVWITAVGVAIIIVRTQA